MVIGCGVLYFIIISYKFKALSFLNDIESILVCVKHKHIFLLSVFTLLPSHLRLNPLCLPSAPFDFPCQNLPLCLEKDNSILSEAIETSQTPSYLILLQHPVLMTSDDDRDFIVVTCNNTNGFIKSVVSLHLSHSISQYLCAQNSRIKTNTCICMYV